MFLAGGCDHRIRDGNSSPQPISRVARGIAHCLTALRLKIGTRELGSPPRSSWSSPQKKRRKPSRRLRQSPQQRQSREQGPRSLNQSPAEPSLPPRFRHFLLSSTSSRPHPRSRLSGRTSLAHPTCMNAQFRGALVNSPAVPALEPLLLVVSFVSSLYFPSCPNCLQ
jgi:hypothetical protein